ncbi:MAG TPA: acyl-CoA thioesterase [Gammaproteobacteria bacterium]|jgi:acyl-CoA thioester hydrolase|nr:acyl-CoA thioesterase [Gammaproteobacteria bacterium]
MSSTYAKIFEVRWADLDPNGHVRHSAYADYGAQARVAFLAEHGFGLGQFMKLRMGPVLFREDLKYVREIRANETIRVSCEAVGISPNRKHWRIRHRVFRQDGELACIIDCQGAWFDLVNRKVIPAPAELEATFGKMPKANDYAEFTPQKEG